MTRAEVEVLLSNQAKARSRREPVSRLEGEGLSISRDCGPHCDCSVCERSRPVAQLTLVKPDALPPAVELVLPLPPSWNQAIKARAVPAGGGKWRAHVYESAEGKAYRAAVGSQLRRDAWPGPFERHIMLRVSGDMVVARAGNDLNNRFKVLFDALQGHVYEDDEQVAEFGRWRRLVDSTNPHVRLRFEPIPVDRYGKATT